MYKSDNGEQGQRNCKRYRDKPLTKRSSDGVPKAESTIDAGVRNHVFEKHAMVCVTDDRAD